MLTWVVVAKNRLYETLERNLLTSLPTNERKRTFWSKSVKETKSFGIGTKLQVFRLLKWFLLDEEKSILELSTYVIPTTSETLSSIMVASEASRSSQPDISASSRHGTFQFGFRLNRLIMFVRTSTYLLHSKRGFFEPGKNRSGL